MRLRRLCCLLLVLVGLSACQSAGFQTLNAISSDAGSEKIASELYAPEQGLLLDVYRSTKATSTARPVVVFFYGGSWAKGEREWYQFAGQALAREGFIAVIPDYRKYPSVRFPTFVEDAAKAVSYVKKRAGQWGGDPARVYLMGHSAGAQIAMLLALEPTYLARVGSTRGALRGVIGVAGPYDFLPLKDPQLVEIFGDSASQQRSQPINFARTDAPPLLLMHGLDDSIVEPRNSQRLADRQIELGATVSLKLLPDVGHIGILLDMRKEDSIVMRNVRDFVAQ